MASQENIESKITAEGIAKIIGRLIDFSMLPQEVKDEAYRVINEPRRGHRRGQINKFYGSVEEYFAIYYCLKFVYKYSNNEIAEVLDTSHNSINHTYEGLGWNYHSDYETNERLRKEKFAELQKIRQEGMREIEKLNITEHPVLAEMLSDPAKIKKVQKILNKEGDNPFFANPGDFMKQVYYFYVVKGFSKDFFTMFGWFKGTGQGWLKDLGIRRSAEEGMRAKKRNGSQDYARALREGQKTAIKEQLKHASPRSSKNEIRFRNFIAIAVYDVFPEYYDVVVGCKNIAILGSLEIDIPITVYNNNTNQFHRFAAEYNGDPYHPDDSVKISRAEKRGWIYIKISDKSEYSRNRRMLDERGRQFCQELYIKVREIESGGSALSVNISA